MSLAAGIVSPGLSGSSTVVKPKPESPTWVRLCPTRPAMVVEMMASKVRRVSEIMTPRICLGIVAFVNEWGF